ncbi:MAG: class I SAM-dependent methyltransferase [Acidimicrobiales bacterium]
MRDLIRAFAEDVATHLPIAPPIVEIGARAAAGQEGIADLRSLFPGREYIGCDVQDGPGVDRIEDVHALSFPDESIGAVLSLDTLEHVADPLRALQEIHRVLKPGGVVAISSVMFFPIHAHPWDYWRFTPEGFAQLLQPFESSLVLPYGYELMPETVFGIGVKGPAELSTDLLPRTTAMCDAWARGLRVDLGPLRFSARQLWGMAAKASLDATRERIRGRRGATPAPR